MSYLPEDPMDEKSSFRPIALGLVVSNKKRGTDEIRVTPIEMFPDLNSDIKDDTEVVTTSGRTADNKPFKMNITRGVAITAKWLGETNRATSPDVRRNEQVLIWQASNANEYFWQAMGRDDNLRRLETVVWTYNANPNNDDAEPSRDNCYVYEINTHDGLVALTTSLAHNEKAKYVFAFNTRDGQVTLEDNYENYIFLDSVEKDIHLQNGDETLVRLIKEDLFFKAKNSINLETDTYNLECTTANNTATTINNKTSTYNETSQTYSHQAGTYARTSTSAAMKDNGYTQNSSNYAVTAPLASFSAVIGCGVLAAGGMVGGGPGGAVAGSAATMSEGATVPAGKDLIVGGEVSANGIPLSTHHHEGGNGGPVLGPVA